jgi:hypothetical protein
VSPAKRQLAWTVAWILVIAALEAGHAPPSRAALFFAAICIAAAMRWVLRNRSSYLALAITVALLGLTASTVANLTATPGRIVRVTPALGALTGVFAVATIVDGLARRRALAVRMAFAAALAVPVAWVIVALIAYVGFSTAKIPLVIVQLNISDPLGRALDMSRHVLQLKVMAPLVLASFAALRATRSA